MSRKNLVKKLVAVIGQDDVKGPVVEVFLGQTKKVFTYKKHVISILEESLGRSYAEDFGSPMRVESHHVRRFFNKLQLGVHAVQNYLGKELTNWKEATDYFFGVIGTKAYGPDWIAKEMVKLFNDEEQGLYLLTDLTLEEAKSFKKMLGNSFATVLVADSSDETVDYLIKPQATKAATKRVTITVIDKLTQTENRKKTNERPITESQLQSG